MVTSTCQAFSQSVVANKRMIPATLYTERKGSIFLHPEEKRPRPTTHSGTTGCLSTLAGLLSWRTNSSWVQEKVLRESLS